MGTCFGKKPSTLNTNKHQEKFTDQSSMFREFTSVAAGGQNSFSQNKQRLAAVQQQQQQQQLHHQTESHPRMPQGGGGGGPVTRSQARQIQCAPNPVNTTNNTPNATAVTNSTASTFMNLQQGHLITDSAVTNTTSITTSSSSEESTNLATNKFNKNAYVALFDYAARTIEDLSFKKGQY